MWLITLACMYRCARTSHPNMCVCTIDVVDNTGLHVQMCYDVTSKYVCVCTIDVVDNTGLHVQMCYDVTSKYVCEYNRCS